MSSKIKEFNKRITVDIKDKVTGQTKVVDRSSVCFGLVAKTINEGEPNAQKVMYASDRVYLVNKDGSLRSTKEKISKKERRRMREIMMNSDLPPKEASDGNLGA